MEALKNPLSSRALQLAAVTALPLAARDRERLNGLTGPASQCQPPVI